MKRIWALILIVSLSLISLTLSIELNSYNKKFYMDSYIKYDIEGVTNKSTEELSEITDDIISYLKGHGGDELLAPHFNQREVDHMKDVQGLFDLSRALRWISIAVAVIIFIYLTRQRDYIFIGKTLAVGLFTNHILWGVLGILAFIDFNKYFTYFHLIFFTNDLWILNPNTDLMIQMLPEAFFMNMAFNIMLSFFVFLAILQIVGYLYIKKGKGKNEGKIRTTKGIFNKEQ